MRGIPKQDRLLNLLNFLLAVPRPVAIGEVFEQVDGYRQEGRSETGDRLFSRDRRDLKALGVPLEFVPGEGGYRVRREAYLLRPVQLTGEDAVTLSFLLEHARARAGSEGSRLLASALAKAVPRATPPHPSARAYRFGRPGKESPGAARVLLDLADACAARRGVRFAYARDGQRQATARECEPYALVRFAEAWYLVGRDRARKEVRTFRVGRIRGAVRPVRRAADGPEYEPPAEFDPGTFFPTHRWQFGPLDEEATLDPDDLARWRIEQETGPHAPGRLRLRVRDPQAFYRWLAPFGTRVRLAGSAPLREGYLAFLEGVRG
ncbi:MAG: WYL domain-containing protein, partial [Planctomycetes bacterium]|nr:WYL domain-containing protein [Planctomycetota bacterium]